MSQRTDKGLAKQGGFTLLELMLVVAILSLIIAAVFSQLGAAQQRLATEEIRLDDFQQARDFVDQFFRDINQIGTPNMQILDTTQTFSPALTTQTSYTYANSYINDNRMAMGLVKIAPDQIWFEGSMNGNGTVQQVIYKVNGSGTCSLCLQRSQFDKATADPLLTMSNSSNQNWGTEVNDIVTNNAVSLFRFFKYDGTEVVPPSSGLAYTSSQANAQTLADVKTIQINLTIRNNNVTDKKTGLPIETSFEGEVSLNNCSMAATGMNMSCQ